ncbi:MAG: DUF983 domain-containing protein [Gemmatimonadaceae bacterium]
MPTRYVEPHSATELRLAGPRQIARLFARALTLRCPNCGGGRVLRHWLKLHVRCPTCGLRIERGEHDYFVGSMLFNFIIAGALFIGILLAVLVATWPSVPWDALQLGAPVLIIVFPFFLFPFSKLLWLAFDLMLRPVTPAEMAWHDAAESEWSTDR